MSDNAYRARLSVATASNNIPTAVLLSNPAKDRIAYYDGPEFHSPYATLFYEYSQRIKQCGGPGQLRRPIAPAQLGVMQAFWQHIKLLNLDVHADSVIGANEAARLTVLHSNTPSPRTGQRTRNGKTHNSTSRRGHRRAATCERVPADMDDIIQIVHDDEPSTEDSLLADLFTNCLSPWYVPTHWSNDAQALKIKCLFRKESMKSAKIPHQFAQLSLLSEFITHIEPNIGQQLVNARELALCANYIQDVNFAHLPPQLCILELYGNCIESDRIHGSVPAELQHLGLGLNRLKNVGFLLATLPAVAAAAAAAAAAANAQNAHTSNTLTIGGGGGSSSQPSSSFSLQQQLSNNSNPSVMMNSRRSSVRQQQPRQSTVTRASAGLNLTSGGGAGVSQVRNTTLTNVTGHRPTQTNPIGSGVGPAALATPAMQLQRTSSLPFDHMIVFQNLTSLDVSQNRIDDIRTFIDCVQYLKALRILRAFGNPMALGRLYRGLLVDALTDALTFVDDARVLFVERQRFRALYELIFKSGAAANNDQQNFGRNSAAVALARQVNTATLSIGITEIEREGDFVEQLQSVASPASPTSLARCSRRALTESLKNNKRVEDHTEYPLIQYEYVLQVMVPRDSSSVAQPQQMLLSQQPQQQRRSINTSAEAGSETKFAPSFTPPPPASRLPVATVQTTTPQPPMLIDPNQAPFLQLQQSPKYAGSLTYSTITEDIYSVHNIAVQTLQKPWSTSEAQELGKVGDLLTATTDEKTGSDQPLVYNTSDLVRLRDFMCCGMQVNVWERQVAYVPVTFFKHYAPPQPQNPVSNSSGKPGKKSSTGGGRDSSASKSNPKDKQPKGGKKSGKEPKFLPLSELASYTVYYRFVGASVVDLQSLLGCNANATSNEIIVNLPVRCLVYVGDADKRNLNLEAKPNVYFVLADADRQFLYSNGAEGGPPGLLAEQQATLAKTKGGQKDKSPPPSKNAARKLTSPTSLQSQAAKSADTNGGSISAAAGKGKSEAVPGIKRHSTTSGSAAGNNNSVADTDFRFIDAIFKCRIAVVQDNSTAETAQRFAQR